MDILLGIRVNLGTYQVILRIVDLGTLLGIRVNLGTNYLELVNSETNYLELELIRGQITWN